MNIRSRLGLAVGGSILWFGWLAPWAAQSIHQSTLEGPPPFSVQHVRDRLSENEDTGAPAEDTAVVSALAGLSSLEHKEEERIMAMWGLLDAQTIATASTKQSQLPPLRYAVDPRFFEPVTPALIQEIITNYGHSPTPLNPATSLKRPLHLDHRDQLMIMLSAVHNKLLSNEQAQMLLSGAISLLNSQTERMAKEDALRHYLEGDSTN
jgi:hypothetical protein